MNALNNLLKKMDNQYIDNVLIYIDCQAALTTPLGQSAIQQAFRVVKETCLLNQVKNKQVVKYG